MKKTSVGMFIPVYHREAKVKDCFGTLATMPFEEGIELHVRIGYNGGSSTLFEYLSHLEWHKCFNTYSIYNPGNNLGKPKIVNDMVKVLSSERHIDYVISFDSDLVVQGEHWVRRFVDAFENCRLHRDLGALSAQQIGDCCHRLGTSYEKYKSPDSQYTYLHPPRNEGVAGAAILTPCRIWKEIGGYQAHRIYASDDAHYALALHEHGFLMVVVDEVSVLHPLGDDPEYVAWKIRAVKDMLRPGEEHGLYK